MVSRVVPLPNGLFMAYKWGLLYIHLLYNWDDTLSRKVPLTPRGNIQKMELTTVTTLKSDPEIPKISRKLFHEAGFYISWGNKNYEHVMVLLIWLGPQKSVFISRFREHPSPPAPEPDQDTMQGSVKKMDHSVYIYKYIIYINITVYHIPTRWATKTSSKQGEITPLKGAKDPVTHL